MILAAEVVTMDSLTLWAVGALLTGGLTVLGFLMRSSFDGFTTSIALLSSKVDDLKASHAKESGDRRVLEVEFRSALHRIERLERAMEQVSEGIVR